MSISDRYCYILILSMKKIFISYSYTHRKDFEEFHNTLKNFLELQYGSAVYAFVFDFNEKVTDKELMD